MKNRTNENDGAVIANPPEAVLARRLASGIYRLADDVLEKRCTICREYWPVDSEFFHQSRCEADGFLGRCRACAIESRSGNQTPSTKDRRNMSTTREDMLNLIRQRQDGLRAVQISDLLDIELPVVESLLRMALNDDQVVSSIATAPNGQEAAVYRISPTNLGWAQTPVGEKLQVRLDEPSDEAAHQGIDATQTPAVLPQAAAQSAAEPKLKSQTKVEEAMAYLAKNGPTEGTALRKAIGLGYSISQLLRLAIGYGHVSRIDNVYYLRDQLQAVAAEKSAAQSGATMSATVERASVVDLLRTQLTTDEFLGFLKGSVIRHTLLASPGGASKDYEEAGVYLNLLAQHSAAAAAQPA